MQLFICETLHRIVGRFLLVLRIEVLVCVFKALLSFKLTINGSREYCKFKQILAISGFSEPALYKPLTF